MNTWSDAKEKKEAVKYLLQDPAINDTRVCNQQQQMCDVTGQTPANQKISRADSFSVCYQRNRASSLLLQKKKRGLRNDYRRSTVQQKCNRSSRKRMKIRKLACAQSVRPSYTMLCIGVYLNTIKKIGVHLNTNAYADSETRSVQSVIHPI